MEPNKSKKSFLRGGGELGELTRNKDWSDTSLGDSSDWPLSLKSALGIILHSAFPMLLFWGEDLLVFYNDAFRPSLGVEGKHPAVGKKGREMWSEIWDFIGPLINGVKESGDPVYFEDQLVPFYRNGRMEDTYWTFSYSPAYDDDDRINGVFVTCVETTEKVLTVQRLRESEKRFRNLIREATMGIIVLIGESLNVQIVNAAYGKLIDRTVDQLLQRDLFDVIPESEAVFRPMLENVMKTGQSLHLFEYPYFVLLNGIRKEGFLNIVYQAYTDDTGKKAGVMALCQDVTQQVLSKRKIEMSELKLRTLMMASPVATALFIGRNLVIDTPNQAFVEMMGKGHNIEGKPLAEIMPELTTENQPFLKILDQVFTTGTSFQTSGTQVMVLYQGEMTDHYYDFNYTPLKDEKGDVYAILETAMDVTEEVQIQKRLAHSEDNLRNTILKAPVAMCILRGPDFVVEIANHRMIELWGKTFEEVNGKPIFQGLPEAKNQGFENLLNNVYHQGKTEGAQGIPINLPRIAGIETVYVNFIYEPFRESDGRVSGVICVVSEVTEQVLARQKIQELVTERTKELATANLNLQRSNSELEQFAYITSHDLQEPLRKVTVFSELLEEHLNNLDPVSSKYLSKIRSSSIRMIKLVRDVLAFSRLSIANVKHERVDLNLILKTVIDDFDLLIEEKKARIEHGELPTIQGNEIQMTQLFTNLISNALKFTNKGSSPIIEIRSSEISAIETDKHIPDEKYFKLIFKDSGIGFDQENAEKIFNIFQRLHGNSEYGGTGIGLALCKKIVQNHRGYIHATSDSTGAEFILLLPASQPSVIF